MTGLRLRQRLVRGGSAQLGAQVARILVQIAMAGILLPAWGLQLYGEWLVLLGLAIVLATSDFGYLSATTSDMLVAVGRGDRDHARDVFQAVSRGLAVLFAALLLLVTAAAALAPLHDWFGLELLDERSAVALVLMCTFIAFLTGSSQLLYGGFASEGHYGEGVFILAGITLAEWTGAAVAAILGHGPVTATAVLMGVRVAGTVAMYIAMRRRAPWLHLGKPSGQPQVIRRLTRPALSFAGIGGGIVVTTQAMVVLVGVLAGPASAGVFGTLRTLSRVVTQIPSGIGQIVGPELGRAYGEHDDELIRRLQRRASQAAAWIAAMLMALLAVFADVVLDVWTQGTVSEGGAVFDLLLVAAALNVVWLTSATVLFFTNRHQRVGLAYMAVSAVSLPVAYLMGELWGVEGVALVLIAVDAVMLVVVLRLSLPAAHETLRGWAASLTRPSEFWRALTALRAQLEIRRRSS